MKAIGYCIAVTAILCVGNVEANKAQLIENFGKIPLSFTINEGQYDPQVKFVTRGSGCDMFFTQEGTTFLLRRETQESAEKRAQQRSVVYAGNKAESPAPDYESFSLKVKFLNANTAPEITGEDPLPGRSNFLPLKVENKHSKLRQGEPMRSRI